MGVMSSSVSHALLDYLFLKLFELKLHLLELFMATTYWCKLVSLQNVIPTVERR